MYWAKKTLLDIEPMISQTYCLRCQIYSSQTRESIERKGIQLEEVTIKMRNLCESLPPWVHVTPPVPAVKRR